MFSVVLYIFGGVFFWGGGGGLGGVWEEIFFLKGLVKLGEIRNIEVKN